MRSMVFLSSFTALVGCAGEIGGGSAGGEGVARSALCEGVVYQSSAAPLRRLNSVEYRASVRDLFVGIELPELEVPVDALQDGYTTVAAGQAPSALSVEQYQHSASKIAQVVVGERARWAPCVADTEACARETLEQLAERAYRRPLAEDERAQIVDLVVAAGAWGGPAASIEAGVEAVLQSPHFLYRPEFGGDEAMGAARVLSAHELATRLSYFLTASMPDAELLAAADSGALLTEGGLRAQAERLLRDPRARDVLTDFFVQWLRLDRLDSMSLDPNAFPEFDDALREDLKASVLQFVDYALWEADSFQFLMAGSLGFVNDRLASLYGLIPPGTQELVVTELDPAERRGLLTQPGVLAASSHGLRHSPILRGVAMLDSILCQPVPAPPAGILDMSEASMVDPQAICTTRDEVALSHTSRAGCQSCHQAIDGAGFAFEHYDALGRYRSEENGCAIDATASFAAPELGRGVADAVALADRLAVSPTVTQCFGRQLFRFALGRTEQSADHCEIAQLVEPLVGNRDSLQELVLALVQSPSFRSRPSL